MFQRSIVLTVLLLLLTACSSKVIKHSEYNQVMSPAMGKLMDYSIYTPPGWTSAETLPMVVLLHGVRDNHETFDRYAVGQFLDQQINAGLLPRVVIVNPDGELGFWENWYDGSHYYRDWVVKDLMPHVGAQYNTKACPRHCYITGISMGDHGAMRFAYYEPGTFNSVAAISAQIISRKNPSKNSIRKTILKWFLPIERIWGDIGRDSTHMPQDLDPYVSWVEKPELKEMPLFLAWGNDDYGDIIESNQRFHNHLNSHDRHHNWLIYDGGHKWTDWRKIIAETIRFHTHVVETKKRDMVGTP